MLIHVPSPLVPSYSNCMLCCTSRDVIHYIASVLNLDYLDMAFTATTQKDLTQIAQRRNLQYWSETVEIERINDMLNRYGLQDWNS
jgi:hypothetical protein